MAKIKNGMKPFDLYVKRFYMPGTVIEDKCPKCGRTAKLDLAEDYLSYPSANKVEEVRMVCSDDCNTEWYVKTKLVVKLELAKK